MCPVCMKHICTYVFSYIFENAGMEMDSLLDPVIDSSHRSYFAAVEHRALEVLRPHPPGEAISIHHDWCDRYVMKYYYLSLMYLSVVHNLGIRVQYEDSHGSSQASSSFPCPSTVHGPTSQFFPSAGNVHISSN